MTLYLKYRPKNFDELDLTDVGSALKKNLSGDKIPHAFLFAGPKGTGKTSAARILAKIINCEGKNPPCDECESCLSITKGTNLDVIEMDAASHRGIDDVRTLRDAVKLAPIAAKKKIYIIDEAHMLTTEASNALLKTLEEPPSHVVFVLATTNPEKLIDTIKSRVTFVPFRKATDIEILRSLKRVADGEKIKIGDDALGVIARASDGAFRDAIKILEQVNAEGVEPTKESLEEYLFSKKSFDLDAFVELLIKKDAKGGLSAIADLGQKGVSIQNFLEALISRLRISLLSKVGVGEADITLINKGDTILLIELLTGAMGDISNSPIEELPLEIAIIKWCDGKKEITNGIEEPQINDEVRVNVSVPEKIDNVAAEPEPVVAEAPIEVQAADLVSLVSSINDDAWRQILTQVKPLNASIEALLRAAKPVGYDGKTLTLGVYYRFHKERLEDSAHRKLLEDVIAKVLQSPTRVSCTLVEPPPKQIIEEAKKEPVLTEGQDRDIIKVAQDIFSN